MLKVLVSAISLAILLALVSVGILLAGMEGKVGAYGWLFTISLGVVGLFLGAIAGATQAVVDAIEKARERRE